MQQSIDPSMRSPLRWAILGFLLCFITLTLMRLRNLILQQERHRPGLLPYYARSRAYDPAFHSWQNFAMGNYAFMSGSLWQPPCYHCWAC